MSELGALVGFCLLAAVVGTCASVAYQAFSSRGERARFSAELDPLKEEIDALRDIFMKWRNRAAKRVRDDGESTTGWDTARVPATAAEREQVKAALRGQHERRG